LLGSRDLSKILDMKSSASDSSFTFGVMTRASNTEAKSPPVPARSSLAARPGLFLFRPQSGLVPHSEFQRLVSGLGLGRSHLAYSAFVWGSVWGIIGGARARARGGVL